MKKKILLLIVVLIIIAGGAGYYYWYSQKNVSPAENPDVSQNIPHPDLERPVNITANISEEEKDIATQKIDEIKGYLKENSDLRDSWLDLASYYKMIGDFDGAREIWEYMIAKNSADFVPYYNLANLYGYYLKDNSKAEEYFKKTIEVNPQYIAGYAAFYDFYTDTDRADLAEGVLKQGLDANPGNEELTQLLEISQNR